MISWLLTALQKQALYSVTRPQKKKATKEHWEIDPESEIGTAGLKYTAGVRWRRLLKTELDGESVLFYW